MPALGRQPSFEVVKVATPRRGRRPHTSLPNEYWEPQPGPAKSLQQATELWTLRISHIPVTQSSTTSDRTSLAAITDPITSQSHIRSTTRTGAPAPPQQTLKAPTPKSLIYSHIWCPDLAKTVVLNYKRTATHCSLSLQDLLRHRHTRLVFLSARTQPPKSPMTFTYPISPDSWRSSWPSTRCQIAGRGPMEVGAVDDRSP
jgi:hypothetical protein